MLRLLVVAISIGGIIDDDDDDGSSGDGVSFYRVLKTKSKLLSIFCLLFESQIWLFLWYVRERVGNSNSAFRYLLVSEKK